jgi:tetratricopeptide (TPR) repeat protein
MKPPLHGRQSIVIRLIGLAAILTLATPALWSGQDPSPNAPGQNQDDRSRDLKPVRPDGQGTTVPAGGVTQSYALVIGIAHYQNLPESSQLRYPDRDAESVYSTLISQQGGQFPANHVHMLTGPQATRANVLHELEEWLPTVTAPQDRVLVYFAGHGFISAGKAYLAPFDVDLKRIADSAISMDLLGSLIGTRIHGNWKVLITDACHSGAITPESNPTELNQSLLSVHQSVFSLTASRDREQSFESLDWGGGHGIFTYYVVRGLAGEADANSDGIVTADELAEYVHTNVRTATQGRQNPTSERGSFDSNMVLAYDPEHAKAPATVASLQYGTLVVQTNMDNTEMWLDGKQVGVVTKTGALRLPGLTPGSHTIKGVHMGYEPDGPREEMVYPGQETTVSLRILIPRQRNRTAVDLLDQGVDLYKKGSEANYRKAAEKLSAAVTLDPTYSQAYMYLGRVENALFEDDKATEAFKKAITIDPDYEEARASYAAALLDQGGLDEAVRQLSAALERKPDDGTALYLLSQAYAREGDYSAGKSAALRAVKAAPANGEAHFWLAECLRHLNLAGDGEAEYQQYLRLTNFNSGAAGQVSYYLAGFVLGMGKRRRAAEQDIWREQQAQANLGICDCEWLQKRDDAAVPYCLKALSLLPSDLWANYRLGLIYVEQANAKTQSQGSGQSKDVKDIVSLLNEAKVRFSNVIAANPDTDEATRARQYLTRIDSALASML